MTTSIEVLSTMFGDHASKESAIQVYKIAKGGPWGSKPMRFDNAKDASEFAEANKDTHDVYFNCLLMAKADKGRGGEEFARIMPTLYADLDAKEGEHKGKRAPKQDLIDMLNSGFIPKPSIVVDSGGGLHAYWLFDEPLTDMGLGKELLIGINDKIKQWHSERGYDYERLKDLARVLRVPGTINQKTTPGNPVNVVEMDSERRYTVEELTFEVPEEKVTKDEEFSHVGLSDTEIIDIAKSKCRKVEQEWGKDGSSYVIKLCRQCVRAGCDLRLTLIVVKQMQMEVNFPGRWNDAAIEKRYKSALQQSEPGEGVKILPKLDDYDVALAIKEKNSNRCAFVKEWAKFVAFDGTCWQLDHPKPIVDAIAEYSLELLDKGPESDGSKEGDAAAKHWNAQCLRYRSARGINDIRGLLRDQMARSFKDFNCKGDLFHCQNVTLRLDESTGEVVPLAHSAEYMNTLTSRVVYNPEAKCPTWLRFIDDITMDSLGIGPVDGMADYLQRLMGYCLTTRVDDQSIYVFYGDGNNGKGAFIRILSLLLDQFATTVNTQMLVESNRSEHATQFASLYGKRCAVAQETKQGCKMDEAQVKWLTGGDSIRCRRMREDEWEFNPTHKLILATNHMPVITGTDHGIWRRLKLVEFAARVVPDPTIEPAMQKELSGILNWAIEGWKKVVGGQGMTTTMAVQKTVEAYRGEMDTVKQFVEEMCELVPGEKTKNTELFACFKQYCDGYGIFRTPSHKKLTSDLMRMGCQKLKSNGVRYMRGIKIRGADTAESEFDDLF